MDDESQGIDLARYLGLLMHWWWITAVVVVLFVALAYVYSTVTKSTVYSARATIQVQETRSGRSPGIGDIQASQELTRTYQELLTGSTLLQMVIDELALEAKVKELRGQIRVSVRSGTALIDVKVNAGDPDTPVDIANTLTQVFIQDTQTTRLTAIRRTELEAEALGFDTTVIRESQLGTLGSMIIREKASDPEPFVTPSTRKNMLLAGMLGIFIGVLITFLVDYSSNKIKSVDQIDRLFQCGDLAPSLMGVVFQWTSKEVADGTLVVHSQPDSIYSEMFRQVRTGFQYAAESYPGKAFMITSVGPQEGKSTILANLGAALAQGGSRVIVLDSDLRRPSLHRFVGLDRRRGGLSTLIADTIPPTEMLRDTQIPELKALLSGPVPANPADLLGSTRVEQIIDELKGECDFLLLDSPPIMAAADPTILASKVDGIILVVTMGETRSDTFQEALRQIQRAGTPIMGYLVNKVKAQGLGYGGYRYRYRYYYYYRSEQETELESVGAGGNGAQPTADHKPPRSRRLRSRIRKLLGKGDTRRRHR